ncbi:hypothetical protein BDF14DRAFT_1881589 [Spinellus fusiger]|nr:hypothetical protein BDF14DRAFT_1881589 [Spinellus fusiger]
MNVNADSFVPSGASHQRQSQSQPSDAASCDSAKPKNRKQGPPRPPRKAAPKKESSFAEDTASPTLLSAEPSSSVAKDKKKKVSLNHLLGFSFTEREVPPPVTLRKQKSNYQPFNKERFVNANFRFLVRGLGDYQINLADPDKIIDWEAVEQVLVTATPPSCPICLSPPVAARITKCGHTFCFPCVLNYFALRENNRKAWHKCPICWDAIYLCDLKNVKTLIPTAVLSKTSQGIREGDTLQMVFLLRPGTSPLTLPVSDHWPLPESTYRRHGKSLIPWHTTPNAMLFARILLAGPDYLESMYTEDSRELKEALLDAIEWGVTDLTHIEDARKKVEEKRIESQLRNTSIMRLTVEALSVWEGDSVGKASASSSLTDYYFFQAQDGQHIYLHPLDTRVLKHAYSDYAFFPLHLEVVATGVQETTMTEDLRKRCKHLSHLPLGCDVTFVEVDLKSLVPNETLEYFERELSARTKKHRDRITREKKDQRMAQAKQKKHGQEICGIDPSLVASDPFFQMNQPMSFEENEAQLAQAIAHSKQASERGPKTVWGTPAVALEEEGSSTTWSDQITVTVKSKKTKNKRLK